MGHITLCSLNGTMSGSITSGLYVLNVGQFRSLTLSILITIIFSISLTPL